MSLSNLLRRTLLIQRNLRCIAASVPNTLPNFEGLRLGRHLSFSQQLKSAEAAPAEAAKAEGEEGASEETVVEAGKGTQIEKIPVETSIRYLQSKAYSITYGSDPVWKKYRRNFKGSIPPRKTRKTCIREGKIATGSPCPICRDEYLVISPENVELLKQFISPYTGQTLPFKVTGVCQKKHKELLSAIDIAKDSGAIIFDVPFRKYDYSEYKK